MYSDEGIPTDPMSMKSKHLLRHAVTALLLLASFAALPAEQEQAGNDWQIDNATVTEVPFFRQLIDGQWFERRPRNRGTFLEVRATLKVAGDGSFGPSSLATAGLLAGAGDVPIGAELLAVGVVRTNCLYLRAPIGAGNETFAKLGAGNEIAILRESDANGPLFLRTRAPSLELCMVFELPDTPPSPLRWRFAERTIPLAAGTRSPAESEAAASDPLDSAASLASSPSVPPLWRRAISSPLLWTALVLAALALVGGVALQRLWRRHRLANGSGSHADSSSALDIPRVGAAHQPTRFASVEPEAGAGHLQFHDAMAALRLGDWERATAVFGEAIAIGLTPTFEAGAWSLRGEAMLNDGDLVGAATCFLRALSSPGVTVEAALPAASQLAAIYRQLRLRRDAVKMEDVRARINPFAGDLGPQRLELIASLARELKHKKRTRMLARLIP